MITNPSFIRAHLSRTICFTTQHGTPLLLLHSVSSKSNHFFMHSVNLERPVSKVFSLRYDNHGFDEYCKIEFPLALKEIVRNPCFRVVGICNGVVCLADDLESYYYNFILWNPYIRKFVILPKPSVSFQTHIGYNACIGFGYDATTNDYKVVRVVTPLDEHETVAEVYLLATGSWSSLGSASPGCFIGGQEPQAFVNGALHWAINSVCELVILKFDMGTQLFSEIMKPKSLELNPLWDVWLLSVSGDRKSIALFTTYDSRGPHLNFYTDIILDIWVMIEYCVEESWTKMITLGPQGPERCINPEAWIELMQLKTLHRRERNLRPKALYIRKSSEKVVALLGARHELVSLDPESQQFTHLGICGYQYCFIDSYEEGLVLLDKTNTVSY